MNQLPLLSEAASNYSRRALCGSNEGTETDSASDLV